MVAERDAGARKKVLLLLIEGFETYEASVFVDVIGWNLVDGDGTTSLSTCGAAREVRSAFGQKMVVDRLVSEIVVDEYDALAVPGGFAEYGFYDEGYSDAVLGIVRAFHAKGKIVASVCVGALVLGRSGILVGKRATTYNLKEVRQAELRSQGAVVVSEPVVVDGNILTCWNPSTAMEVAFLLLEHLTSVENGAHLRKIMGFPSSP